MKRTWGGIEAGGTKIVCAVGNSPEQIIKETRFPTTTPDDTIKQISHFFLEMQKEYEIASIGLGSFGPIDLNPKSKTYGYITNTPKPHWSQVDFLGGIKKYLALPFYFDTDVNAAAYGEYKWGAAQNLDTFVYLTIGTGVGGGAFVNGKLLHGLVHPEMGHISIPYFQRGDQKYKNNCPFHNSCLEGYINGPSLEKNWGIKGEKLLQDHEAWEYFTEYLAYGLINMICILSPQKIILGGGVMNQLHLFPLIREKVVKYLNNYVQHS
ncbi:MAG: ROK family protein, partial [Spirochaetes bacterium]|nr:ROK family protein [Spirochaetota bacterium]